MLKISVDIFCWTPLYRWTYHSLPKQPPAHPAENPQKCCASSFFEMDSKNSEAGGGESHDANSSGPPIAFIMYHRVNRSVEGDGTFTFINSKRYLRRTYACYQAFFFREKFCWLICWTLLDLSWSLTSAKGSCKSFDSSYASGFP